MNTDYNPFRSKSKKLFYPIKDKDYLENTVEIYFSYIIRLDKNLGDRFEDKSINWMVSKDKISLGIGRDKSIILNSNGNLIK